MSVGMTRHILGLALLFVTACGGSDLLGIEAPKQSGKVNPMTERGARGFEQRKKDCYEMPNAQACYDVGLNYEMGLAGEPDPKLALEYYDKACELEHQEEHCEAAKRLRED
jgi:TPR repeat protein